jgi:crotonobetainyl-CoA:carnitine CoA-transferase CaiB-like acyl-CoA transferase
VTRREPRSSHPSLTPSQLYRTQDGWIFLMCNKEKFWWIFAELVGRPEWVTDPDFADFAARLANRPRVNAAIDAVLAARTTEEWMAVFAGRVPAAPVYDVAQALDNPFAHERGRIVTFAHPQHGPIKGIASPVTTAGTTLPTQAAPALGADTDDILAGLRYSAESIAALRARNVVR